MLNKPTNGTSTKFMSSCQENASKEEENKKESQGMEIPIEVS